VGRGRPDRGGGHFDYPNGCFVTGRIGSTVVACLSVELQLRFRAGYELRDVDRHDLALLAALDR
jgi:hypothetical protein